MPFYEFEGIRPVLHPSSFVHESATIIGDVVIGPSCFVGPGAVLRGDLARIEMEQGSNIQDNCIVHSFWGRDTIIAKDGHIGHGAVLHGCTISENVLVGINAVVMDGATIGMNSWVAALAFVKAETIVPPNVLVVGCPSRVARTLSEKDIIQKGLGTSNYHHLSRRYPVSAFVCDPLEQLNPNRMKMPTPE